MAPLPMTQQSGSVPTGQSGQASYDYQHGGTSIDMSGTHQTDTGGSSGNDIRTRMVFNTARYDVIAETGGSTYTPSARASTSGSSNAGAHNAQTGSGSGSRTRTTQYFVTREGTAQRLGTANEQTGSQRSGTQYNSGVQVQYPYNSRTSGQTYQGLEQNPTFNTGTHSSYSSRTTQASQENSQTPVFNTGTQRHTTRTQRYNTGTQGSNTGTQTTRTQRYNAGTHGSNTGRQTTGTQGYNTGSQGYNTGTSYTTGAGSQTQYPYNTGSSTYTTRTRTTQTYYPYQTRTTYRTSGAGAGGGGGGGAAGGGGGGYNSLGTVVNLNNLDSHLNQNPQFNTGSSSTVTRYGSNSVPNTGIISDDPNCPASSSYRVYINQMECSQAVDTLGSFICYNYERVSRACCEKCLSIKRSSNRGCEYGDRSYQCRNMEAFDCYVPRNREICCHTCNRYEQQLSTGIAGCQYSDHTPRCQIVGERRHLCYLTENQRLCCQTCPRLEDLTNPSCRWGDQNPQLCEPFTNDNQLRVNCYQTSVRQVCCSTCERLRSRIRVNIPGCQFGDRPVRMNTPLGMLDCREYVRQYGLDVCDTDAISTHCCYTCYQYRSLSRG